MQFISGVKGFDGLLNFPLGSKYDVTCPQIEDDIQNIRKPIFVFTVCYLTNTFCLAKLEVLT